MILDALIGLVNAILEGLLALVPSYTLPASITGFTDAFAGKVGQANAFFPLVTLGGCILSVLGVYVFTFAWKVLVFVYDRIPFKAT